MIKRPTPEDAETNPGFWGTLFASNADGPPTPLAKPSTKKKEAVVEDGFGPGDGVEMTVKSANEKGDKEDDKLMASKPNRKAPIRKTESTLRNERLHSLSLIKHGSATDWDKFIAYRDLLWTLWYRKMKYSSGAMGVAITSYSANILMLMLCLFVRMQCDGEFLVDYSLFKDATPADQGMSYVGLQLPNKAIYNETVHVGFAPCSLDTNGDPVSGDPLNSFISYYKGNYPSQFVNPIDDWDIKCFESEQALETHYTANPSAANFGAYIIESATSSLIDTTTEVQYKLRQNASMFESVNDVYGGSHDTELGVFMYLATFELQMQLHFEHSLVNYRLGKNDTALGYLDVKMAPTSGHYDYEGKAGNFETMAPTYLMMLLSSIVCELLQEVLTEKEGKYKATMQVAGTPDWAYWSAWATYMVLQMAIPMLLVTIMAIGLIFKASDPLVIVLFIFFSMTSFVSLTLCVSACLFNASLGAVIGTAAVWALSIPGFVLDSGSIALWLKYVVLLLPPCSYTYALKALATKELPKYPLSEMGIQFSNLFDAQEGSVSLGACLLFLIFDTGFFILLAWYLEKVIPDQWGKHLPLSFILDKTYWTGEETKSHKKQVELIGSLVKLREGGSLPGVRDADDDAVTDKKKEVGLDVRCLRKVYGEDATVIAEEENVTYLFGHEWLENEWLVESRSKWLETVKSPLFEGIIYFFIALNIVCIILDNERFHNNDEDAILILDVSNYVFCAVFTLECILKLYGMGGTLYFKDPFNWFDLLLVLASYVEIVIVGGGASSAAKASKASKGVRSVKAAKLAKFARMAKMIRVLRIAKLLRWFSHDDSSNRVTVALDNLNLVAYKNEILSLLGQNGAGKTTFFSMLMGLNEPTSGVCMVNGVDILVSRDLVKKTVGSCPQHDILFDWYTVKEHLMLYATLKGIAEEDLEEACAATLEHMNLEPKADAFVNHLSGGMRRRTSIAIACLGDPSIVLLDEPSAGVDVVNRQIVWRSLIELKKGRTIIMSTHFMEEAEILGDSVAVLKKGKLQVHGTCAELHNQFGAGYTLVINRPLGPDDLSSEDALKELEHTKQLYVKKAADVMEAEEAGKIAETVAKEWTKHLPPPENPVLKRKIALAAKEVEDAKEREKNALLCDPAKILKFIKKYIPEVELLDYTDEQGILEYILPFESRKAFSELFMQIDEAKNSYGFKSFGVSAPTLQEVFLEINDMDEAEFDNVVRVGVDTVKKRRRSSVVNTKKRLSQTVGRKESMKTLREGKADALTEGEGGNQEIGDLELTGEEEAHLEPESQRRKTVGLAGSVSIKNKSFTHKAGIHEGTVNAHDHQDFAHRRTSLMGKITGKLRHETPKKGDEFAQSKKKKTTMSSNMRKKKVIAWSGADPHQEFYKQLKAMVVKRYIVSKRNRHGMLLQGVLPIFMVLLGVLFTSINHEIPDGYYTKTSLELEDNYVNSNLDLWIEDTDDESPLSKHSMDILSGTNIGLQNETTLTLACGISRTVSLPSAFLLGEVSVTEDLAYANNFVPGSGLDGFKPLPPSLGIVRTTYDSSANPPSFMSNVDYNGTNLRSVAGLVNLITESYLREAYDKGIKSGSDAGAAISVSYHGLPMTPAEIDNASVPPGIGLIAAILIFMSFASITTSQCADEVKERESGCKRQQLISGINPVVYWSANYVFDFAFFLAVPFAGCVGVIAAFDVKPFSDELSQFCTMLVYWGLASTSFAYVGSFVFSHASSAQQLMMTLNTIVSLLLVAVTLFTAYAGLEVISTPIRFFSMLLPNCSLGFSMWTFIQDGTLLKDSTKIQDDGMFPCYVMLAEFVIYFVLAIAMENTQDKAAKGYAKSKIGTIDEVKPGPCQPNGDTARWLRKSTQGKKFKAFIFAAIIVNMIVIVIDIAEEDSEDVMFILAIALLNYIFTFIFILEMVMKLGGFGPIVYCRDPFNIFDGILVIFSIAELFLAGSNTFTAARSGKAAVKSTKMLKLVRIFKFARLLRILRYTRFMSVAAQYETKKSEHEILEIKREEELQRKSSGRRESIVRRLSLLGGEAIEGSAVDLERKRITRRLSKRYSDEVRRKSKESLGDAYFDTDMAKEEEEESPATRNERGDAIAMQNVVKVYERSGTAPVTAINDVGFGVRQGEIFTLLGPNGAGKSTCLNMMTGSIAPTSGEIFVLDKNITTQFELIKSNIGFCPQFDALVGYMNSYETLTMFGRIKGIPESDLPPLVESLVECIGLKPHAHKMCMQYSGGNRRKLSVAIALMGNPELIFLDEPSAGMDPKSLTDVYSCVWMWTRFGKNRSIILTTHSMEEADSLSDRIGILVNGKLAVLGTSQELKSSFGMNYTFESTLEAGEDLHERVMDLTKLMNDNVEGVVDDGSFDGRVRLELPQDNLNLSRLFCELEEKRDIFKIKDYTISQTTLEQVFIHFAQHQH